MKAKEGKFVSLPGVDVMSDKKDQMTVLDLLEEGSLLKSDIERKEVRLNEIKDELLSLQVEYELEGFRNGPYSFSASFQEGKRSLSKELLIENGVGPDVLASSYKVGEGYWKKELKKLDE